jgi:glyoxylase-like metal-dependent hydrolase (beta-lactamase superfamily II)
MKKIFRFLPLLLILFRGHSSSAQSPHAAVPPSQDAAQSQHPPLTITPLTGNLYVYTTWGLAGGQPYPANGLYLVTKAGVVVMDSPWDTTQFQPLLDTIWRRHHQPVVLCIATHFHEDRTAALDYFQTKGVKTYTSRQTDSFSRVNGKPRAQFLFDKDTVFTVGGYSIQTYYPGEGHTRDNIVVWFGRDRVLYGGCLIKSTEAGDLGYTKDGNAAAYAATIRHVQQKFPHPAYVIPGHQGWGTTASVQHTLEMAEKTAAH